MAAEDHAQAAPDKIPGTLWYVLGVILIVGGAGLFVSSLFYERARIAEEVRVMPRVVLPAGGVFTLENPGTYHVYYEGPEAAGEARLPFAEIEPALTVTRVASADKPEPVIEARPPAQIDAYPMGEHNGYAVAAFDAPAAGEYRIAGRLSPQSQTPSVVAIGLLGVTGIMTNWAGVFGGAVAATLGLVVGTVMIAITLMFRRREVTRRDD